MDLFGEEMQDLEMKNLDAVFCLKFENFVDASKDQRDRDDSSSSILVLDLKTDEPTLR